MGKLFLSVPLTYVSNWALLCSRALFSLLSISIAYNYNQGLNYSRQIKMRLCLSNLVNVFIWSRTSNLVNVFTWRASRVKPSQRFPPDALRASDLVNVLTWHLTRCFASTIGGGLLLTCTKLLVISLMGSRNHFLGPYFCFTKVVVISLMASRNHFLGPYFSFAKLLVISLMGNNSLFPK